MPVARRERAAVVGLSAGGSRRLEAERSLEELAGLAEAAGAQVVLRVLQERLKPHPSTFLGRGKAVALAESCVQTGVDLVIFDSELASAQLRQVEELLGCRVVDRTQLILDIFARRARTREGRLQVELAQLQYLLPRLVGAGVALSRLGGGIGHQGPRRNEAGDRSAPDPYAHPRAREGDRSRTSAPSTPARAPTQSVGPDGRSCRVHQRR